METETSEGGTADGGGSVQQQDPNYQYSPSIVAPDGALNSAVI